MVDVEGTATGFVPCLDGSFTGGTVSTHYAVSAAAINHDGDPQWISYNTGLRVYYSLGSNESQITLPVGVFPYNEWQHEPITDNFFREWLLLSPGVTQQTTYTMTFHNDLYGTAVGVYQFGSITTGTTTGNAAALAILNVPPLFTVESGESIVMYGGVYYISPEGGTTMEIDVGLGNGNTYWAGDAGNFDDIPGHDAWILTTEVLSGATPCGGATVVEGPFYGVQFPATNHAGDPQWSAVADFGLSVSYHPPSGPPPGDTSFVQQPTFVTPEIGVPRNPTLYQRSQSWLYLPSTVDTEYRVDFNSGFGNLVGVWWFPDYLADQAPPPFGVTGSAAADKYLNQAPEFTVSEGVPFNLPPGDYWFVGPYGGDSAFYTGTTDSDLYYWPRDDADGVTDSRFDSVGHDAWVLTINYYIVSGGVGSVSSVVSVVSTFEVPVSTGWVAG